MMRPHTIEASPIANFDSKSISQTKSKSQGNPKIKDLSRDLKNAIFLDTIRNNKKQKKEQNNGNTNNTTNQQQDKPRESQGNDSSNSYSNIGTFGGNAPMATRGYGNSGEIPQQPSSTENNPRGNKEESRSSSESRESRAMGEGSQGLGEGSQSIGRINKQKARLTNYELNGLNGLETTAEKHKQVLMFIKKLF